MAWSRIHGRCNNPKDKAFKYYGARGIRVSSAWDTFEPFLRDIGRAPTPKHTLERIDNSRGYEPGNVRWATMHEQLRNTRASHFVTAFGQRRVLTDWAHDFEMPVATLRHRIDLLGIPAEVALVLPIFARGTSKFVFEASRDVLVRAHDEAAELVRRKRVAA